MLASLTAPSLNCTASKVTNAKMAPNGAQLEREPLEHSISEQIHALKVLLRFELLPQH
jgi:hypothetical protein